LKAALLGLGLSLSDYDSMPYEEIYKAFDASAKANKRRMHDEFVVLSSAIAYNFAKAEDGAKIAAQFTPTVEKPKTQMSLADYLNAMRSL
jgi:hypothetical protein